MRTGCVMAACVVWAASAVAGTVGKLVPVPFEQVTIEDSFWSPRLETNRKVSIPHNLDTCESTGRTDNFRHAAGVTPKGKFRGHIFHDSDVFKVLEGVAYSLHTHPDPKLEARLDEIIGYIAKSQQPDGYLNTWFIVARPKERWKNLRHAHELYCAGHMFEAAVAHYRATGKKTFLAVACKYADYIDTVFGPDKRHGIAGHPEIELALVKLWRATGNERYLKLARFFVEEHGNSKDRKLFGGYCQDHAPVREQTEPVGHAVRFLYFYSGVADLAGTDGDQGYIDTMERLWQFIATKKMYVTGGVGVQGHGEGFARPYYLPTYRAYCETCASIGMVFWNHRLALLHGEGRFADLVERLLYNGAISGIALDGSKFFYVNPLASKGNHHRQAWYGCACCPTNVVRFLSSVGQYVYGRMADGEGVTVLQYVAGKGTVELKSGKVTLVQNTRYPWAGEVSIVVEPERAGEFTVQVRIPAWCEGASVSVDGKVVSAKPRDGFVALRRKWAAGATIALRFPLLVRQVEADPQVEACTGRLAVMRGPVVYCLEDTDNACAVDQVAIPKGARFQTEFQADLLGGVTVLRTKGQQQAIAETADGFDVTSRAVDLTLIPYYAWDNREPGRMVVWVPAELPQAADLKGATIAFVARASSSHRNPRDGGQALNDNVLPKSSIDHDVPRFTWWPHKGTTEWVVYTFSKPKRLSKAEVYWFDDTGRGGCRVPKSWRLLYRDGKEWKPVEGASAYGVEKDKLNRVAFQPVTTTALRLEVQLQPNFSGGILEWRLPK